ncbi:C-type mannose receptor 2 [Bombina bombina]|uniref:C-type mannose receptor 2 n=1 Tax=Bombina bombina TaxID=8345 RepID=UPI00235ADF51|nr:C-type mannose receptor 2 [Bombina bombina]
MYLYSRHLDFFQWLLSLLIQCAILSLVTSSQLGGTNTDVFLVYSPDVGGCLESRDPGVRMVRPCNTSSPTQQWIWVSRRRLFNLGSLKCLWVPSPINGSSSTISTYSCDHENFHTIRRCESQLEQLSSFLLPKPRNITGLQQPPTKTANQWVIYGTNKSICSALYLDIYTIQGNSNGRPCAIPFKYDNQWFYSCTSTGREDGHLWCATTVDYGKDEKWGFCPVKSDDCEAFWDKDPLTRSCYQFNFQSALSWSESWTSCRQQNAHLLSISEIYEQTYINGGREQLFKRTDTDHNKLELGTLYSNKEKIHVKELKLWWDIEFLEHYLEEKKILRGLRMKKFPAFHKDFPEFMISWNESLTECSLILMEKLVKFKKEQREGILSEIENLDKELEKFKDDEKIIPFQKQLDEALDKLNTELSDNKYKTYERDAKDYDFGIVYNSDLAIECDPGWQSFGKYCYRLNSEKKIWQDARRACVRLEGELVSVHTLLELDYVNKQIKQDVEELWIGLNDLKRQMHFEWSDASTVTFTSWHPFEPNNFRDSLEDCVTIWGPEGKWNDSPCNQTLPSICKKLGQVAQVSKDDNHGCQKGWKWHSPSCYWLGEDQLTYTEATKACSDRSAKLVTITNRFDQAFVNSLLYGSDESYYWTALQDMNSTGVFSWLSGEEVIYTHWNRDHPGYERGGCVALATGRSLGLWEVKDCNEFRAKYMCMQRLLTPVTPLTPSIPTPSLNGSCPDDWNSAPNLRHCYKVYHSEKLQDKKAWISAQLSCREIGAQLLSISSVEEEHFVAHLLNKIFGESDPEIHEQHWFWIGLNRRDPSGDNNWVWSDGLGYSYHNFDRSNHDDDDIRRCVVLDLSSLQWLALECESSMDWICKLPKGTEIKQPEVTEGSREWVQYEGAEYKFFEHHSTWVQAQRICTWFQAELVSIHNQNELDFLGQNLQKFSRGQEQHWWIGLHTYENDGRFRWSDGSVLSFVSWATGRPRPYTREKKCVYMTASREDWGDQKCVTALPYICKRSNDTVPQPPVPSISPPTAGGCPRSWLPFLNKCFGVRADSKAELKTWQQARDSCKVLGGELATISNYLEQAFITSIIPTISFDLWIGLHNNRRKFQWADGQPLSYTNWAPREPSGYGPSSSSDKPINCAVVWHGPPSLFTGRWDDRNCLEEKQGYICQISKVPTLNPPSEPFPPPPGSTLSYRNNSYLILQKPMSWSDARLLCETRNATLSSILDPFQQAYLTMAVTGLQTPLWIGLSNEEGGRSHTWLTDNVLSYTNWRDGEPQHLSACVYMDSKGTWSTASCESKLQGAICSYNVESVKAHKWSSAGTCPRSFGETSWIAFRDYCYSFHMEVSVSQKEAAKRCQKVGGEVLSISDETENVFVWEHLQTYESQSKGAWLGMSFNTKGGALVWNDNTPVNYSNWGQQDTGPSLLSPNSCYWIQGSNGVWSLGSCTNISMGVICKLSREGETDFVKSALPEHTTAVVVVVLSTLALIVLIVVSIYLYRRRKQEAKRGAFESARYSRTNSSPGSSAEKNILVSDMEMNEQQE